MAFNSHVEVAFNIVRTVKNKSAYKKSFKQVLVWITDTDFNCHRVDEENFLKLKTHHNGLMDEPRH